MNWQSCIERYENELVNNVIPFWEKNCIDKEFGGYFTSLDRDGSVYDTNKYMWMQWRIVYMFMEFYLSPYKKEEFLKIAEDGFDFLYKHGRDENGMYYFALNRKGVPAMAPYSLFSDCFAAMGAAFLYKATKKELYKEAAEEAMNNYLKRAQSSNPALQWNKGLEGKESYLSLGQFMMMANLGLIMDDCLGENKYGDSCRIALDKVLNFFYVPVFKLIFENMKPDGTTDLESCQGRMLNPGHALEAMWFLLSYLEKRPGSEEQINKICDIILSTLEYGWDKQYGGIYYFMDVLGKPHLELQHDMKLWWVHNEAIIASLYAYKLTEKEVFLEWFRKLDEWTWKHFPDPKYGEWFAYLNRQGEPTHMLKGGKWKTFFHLPRCLYFSVRLMKEIAEKGL